MLDKEDWRPIPGFAGYEASSAGRIRSKHGRVIAQRTATNGYLRVGLYAADGSKKTLLVHRLVLSAFAGPSTLHCNHINNRRADNRPENLEWVTLQQNHDHAKAMGLYARRLKPADIPRIRGRIADGAQDVQIAKEFGVSHGAIWAIKSGRSWTYFPGVERG